MKLGKIVNAVPALQKLSAADLTLKTLYWIRKLISKLEHELKFYYDSRQSILEKYKESQTGDRIKIKENCISLANKEMSELLDMEVEVDFTVPEILDSENIKLSVNDLMALEGFVKFIFEDDITEDEPEESESAQEDDVTPVKPTKKKSKNQ